MSIIGDIIRERYEGCIKAFEAEIESIRENCYTRAKEASGDEEERLWGQILAFDYCLTLTEKYLR
jgi:hypothetical protein